MAAPTPLRSDYDGPALRRLAKASADADQRQRLLALAVICDSGRRGSWHTPLRAPSPAHQVGRYLRRHLPQKRARARASPCPSATPPPCSCISARPSDKVSRNKGLQILRRELTDKYIGTGFKAMRRDPLGGMTGHTYRAARGRGAAANPGTARVAPPQTVCAARSLLVCPPGSSTFCEPSSTT